MRAMFLTRCGCSQMLDIEMSIEDMKRGHIYRLPLSQDVVKQGMKLNPICETRAFEMVEYKTDHTGRTFDIVFAERIQQ